MDSDAKTTKVDASAVQGWFADQRALRHYSEAVKNVGLWCSEEKVLRQIFSPDQTLLDLGTGTGRVAFGLWEIGYDKVMGVDSCRPMIQEARHLNKLLEYRVSFRVEDACKMSFEENLFDGVIFAFNGLMQIPGEKERSQAVKEIFRVLRPGGHFVFTTHDRNHWRLREFFANQAKMWSENKQDPRLREFGDNLFDSREGTIFMHLPDREEVRSLLDENEFMVLFDAMREEIANEPPEVRDFADECRFWVARKPDSVSENDEC
ncbi:MAG: class I SAM-dependent methyltransferase [Opitutales bacterium]|nr:class I SAM-dependent methyltransferase [Opitutales bacterium]MCH8539238.1 class I SAM-dependent methyltransferase [Opitutales bacterium]